MALSKVEKNYRQLLQLKYGIVGESQQIQEVIDTLEQAAPTDLTVLITGETGTGKEVFANAIHGLSNRRNYPFVSVNCGAIPETLLESELFGHEKGAFTGAVDSRKGFFEAANKGTIFLDEIGDMPIGTQVKLLRVLENGEFSRLGSTSIQKVDVRIVAATNRELEKHVSEGTFRQDLFFRLNSVRIKLPPLRSHPQDIPYLAEHFAEKVCDKINSDFMGFSKDALSILQTLPWQGNIRELKNMIETVVTLEKGAFITPELLKKYIPPALPEYRFEPAAKDVSLVRLQSDSASSADNALIFRTLLDIKSDISDMKRAMMQLGASMSLIQEDIEEIKHRDEKIKPESGFSFIDFNENLNLQDIEKYAIERALSKHDNNRRLAAQELGISERTLYRKIIEYGLE